MVAIVAAPAPAAAEAAAAARRCRPTGHAAACRRHLETRNYLRSSPGHESRQLRAIVFVCTRICEVISWIEIQLIRNVNAEQVD